MWLIHFLAKQFTYLLGKYCLSTYYVLSPLRGTIEELGAGSLLMGLTLQQGVGMMC